MLPESLSMTSFSVSLILSTHWGETRLMWKEMELWTLGLTLKLNIFLPQMLTEDRSDETLESCVSLPRCMHHGQIVWVLIEEGGVWCAVLRGVEGPLHSQKHLVEYQTRLAGCTCLLSTARRLGPRWSQVWCQTPETGSVSYCPLIPLPVKFPSENSLLKY